MDHDWFVVVPMLAGELTVLLVDVLRVLFEFHTAVFVVVELLLKRLNVFAVVYRHDFVFAPKETIFLIL